MIATALMTGAFSSVAAQPSSSVLQSLPAEVQKEIEVVRAGCREHLGHLGADASQTRFDELAWEVPRVSNGDEGLEVFTVSGAQAVMVSNLELCGGECLKGANCSNRASYHLAIYIRSGNTLEGGALDRGSRTRLPEHRRAGGYQQQVQGPGLERLQR